MMLDSASASSQLLQGVTEFNNQDFYTCHDTLEALWMSAGEPEKKFYQGILQVAVGCYHLGNKNLRGASILLGEGINKLQRYQPDYLGIDVDGLIEQSAYLLGSLQALALQNTDGTEVIAEDLKALPLPQVNLVSPEC